MSLRPISYSYRIHDLHVSSFHLKLLLFTLSKLDYSNRFLELRVCFDKQTSQRGFLVTPCGHSMSDNHCRIIIGRTLTNVFRSPSLDDVTGAYNFVKKVS